MKLTLFFWSVCVAAGPLHHVALEKLRSSPPTPNESVTSSFVQAESSVNELPSSIRNIQARADPVAPPGGAVFFDVKGSQWDQNNKNNADKNHVNAAWTMAMELVNSAIKQLQTLGDNVVQYSNSPYCNLTPEGEPRDARSCKLAVREYIAQHDPAYTQMFAADQASIDLIRGNFQKVRDGVSNQNTPGRNNNLIYLTAIKNKVRQIPEVDPSKDLCKKAQAFVAEASTMQWWVDMTSTKPPGDAMVINFCEDFFSAKDLSTELQNLKKGASKKEDICDLGNLDNTARILLHEWTHFPYTLNTNPRDSKNAAVKADSVGWKQAASNSIDKREPHPKKPVKAHQPALVGAFCSQNADSYAQFAVYGYMNNVDSCAGVHWNNNKLYTAADGVVDIWPPSEKVKEVKNRWGCYVPGDREPDTDVSCLPGSSEDVDDPDS